MDSLKTIVERGMQRQARGETQPLTLDDLRQAFALDDLRNGTESPAGIVYRYEVLDERGALVFDAATAREALAMARLARNRPGMLRVAGAYAWDRAEQRRVREGER